MGDLPGGICNNVARGVSADGAVIVGSSRSAAENEAFVWTAADGMVSIGDLPGGYLYAEGWDASADGSVVVGLGSTDAGERAFIWDAAHGMRELATVLANDYGLDPAYLDNWTLGEARGVSADGRTIVGIDRNALGKTEVWIVRLPAALTPGDVNCDGLVNPFEIDPFILALTNPPGYAAAFPACSILSADCNGDGRVNAFDIDPFIALLVP